MLFSKSLQIIITFLLISSANGYPSSKESLSEENPLEQNPNLFEGDMRFPNINSSPRGVLRRGNSVAWTNGIIPYEILSHYKAGEMSTILSTMRKMERLIAINPVKCIQFRPRIASDPYYITIRNGSGCSSYVGQNTGVSMERTVTLQHPVCIYETIIMHQLLHALGFYHEQSRPDRDNYIRVNYSNIQSGMEYNFEKYTTSYVDTQNTPYDYASVMHYGANAFSSNGYPTVEPLQAGVEIGQRYNMSSIDIQEVRLFYNCSSTSPILPPLSTTTANLYNVNTTIASSLTTNSSIYDRLGTFNGCYYYESYEIRVPLDNYYIFTSEKSIGTYVYLYRSSFNAYYPYLNLIDTNFHLGESNKILIEKYLSANETYILIFTTYYPLIVGEYQLTISSLSPVQIEKLNSISVVFATTTSYTSSLTKNSSMFNRHGSNGTFYYQPFLITLSINGTYLIRSNASVDTYGYLYLNSFDANNTAQNLIAYNDNNAGDGQFGIVQSLSHFYQYILVVTTYSENATVNFSISVAGPVTVSIVLISNISTTIQTTVPTTTTTTTAYQFISVYSSSLTRNSSIFTRHGSNGIFYYQPILVQSTVNGLYRIESYSSLDTYGLLYLNSFNPYNTTQNLLNYDDDGALNAPFLISQILNPSSTYILVVTTYSMNITGNFSIIVSGPSTIYLTEMIHTITRETTTTTDKSYTTSMGSKQSNILATIFLFAWILFHI